MASYLTNSMPTLERFPISFKTYFSGNYFRHIVLGVNFGGRYGALGMSRREDLMYKPPAFRTLSELVLDYEAAYGRCWHVLKKVKLGQCVSHDPHSVEQIEWKHSVLDVERLGREDFRKELERHARDMRLKVSVGPRATHGHAGPGPGCGNGGAAAFWCSRFPGCAAPTPRRGDVRSKGGDPCQVYTVSGFTQWSLLSGGSPHVGSQGRLRKEAAGELGLGGRQVLGMWRRAEVRQCPGGGD